MTCSVDGGAQAACVSPLTAAVATAGSHTFTVTVSNAFGSRSATSYWYAF